MDGSGWTTVDSVLRAFARQSDAIDLPILVDLVETNDKRRFELSPDACFIRARQGHSLDVEGDWRLATPPDHLWHGTVEKFMPAILTEGLRPMGRHHVHLSDDRDIARRVGERRGRPVLLAIDAKALAEAGQEFWKTGNDVWLTGSVPPAAFRRD